MAKCESIEHLDAKGLIQLAKYKRNVILDITNLE